jgi:nucleotide-binding universal stress UspA family protein
VLFAYDGSDHAKASIVQAGEQLRTDRKALVVTVWEGLESVPFLRPPLGAIPEEVFNGMVAQAGDVAKEGAELARAAGFDAEPLAERGEPIWMRIVELADENDAAVIVIGSHGRSGVKYALMGSVATAVAQHTKHPVLVTRMASA